ncbi:hypothetical protein OH77DRAFT_1426811 [Trametes cingulata]|nr:hypothetical protein OH77DRAFT_1426811 [Trametes cingulata]
MSGRQTAETHPASMEHEIDNTGRLATTSRFKPQVSRDQLVRRGPIRLAAHPRTIASRSICYSNHAAEALLSRSPRPAKVSTPPSRRHSCMFLFTECATCGCPLVPRVQDVRRLFPLDTSEPAKQRRKNAVRRPLSTNRRLCDTSSLLPDAREFVL